MFIGIFDIKFDRYYTRCDVKCQMNFNRGFRGFDTDWHRFLVEVWIWKEDGLTRIRYHKCQDCGATFKSVEEGLPQTHLESGQSIKRESREGAKARRKLLGK